MEVVPVLEQRILDLESRLREGDAGSAESVEDQFESFFNKDDNIEINVIERTNGCRCEAFSNFEIIYQ